MPSVARTTATSQKLTSWSFSRYKDYTDCPKKAYYKHIAAKNNPRLKEPGNAAMDRGTEIHGKAEGYIKGVDANGKKVMRVAPELACVAPLLKELRALYKSSPGQIVVEENWGFRQDWSQTRWDDWTGCYARIKLDVAYAEGTTLNIIDWKTGKFSAYKLEEYLLQQELYALTGMLKYPKAETVVPKLAFTDADVIYPREGTDDPDFVFTRKDEPRLIKLWDKRIKPMMNDTSFKEKPGDACRFCYYRANGPLADQPGGAPCKYKG
jgi:hypothetical protein